MDSHQFRAILLKLQDRLSDNDRKRLHFFFGNDVPRRIRDDPSLGGTLSLMESLFDQDKINEQDFTFLITAFDEIQCRDAVRLLREHMQRLRSNGLNKSMQSLASIMPSTVDQLLQDQEEDKYNIQSHLITQQNMCGNNNKIIDSNNTSINSVTVTLSPRTALPPPPSPKKLLASLSTIQNCLILIILLVIIAFAILIGFYIYKVSRIVQLENDLKMKDTRLLEEQTKNNNTIRTIDRMTDQLRELEKVENISLIKVGAKFGGTGGDSFDDSLTRNFTCSHYLRGMITRLDMVPLDWFQFLYSSPQDPDNILKADFHGSRTKADIEQRFILEKDEKIYKIQGKYDDVTFYNGDKPLYSLRLIRGIRFFTTKGRVSQSIDHAYGESFTEQFDGYTVGYVTGRTGPYVNQLRFYWYRTLAV